jgi:hypothetical protein
MLFITIVCLSNCSDLDVFKFKEPPKYFLTLSVDCTNLESDTLLSDENNLELRVFFMSKTYPFGNKISLALQELAEQDGIIERNVLSCYNYRVIPDQVILDKVEISKDTEIAIFLLKEGNGVISETNIRIHPAKNTPLISVSLVGDKILIKQTSKTSSKN